jgi:hypothetical protein
MQLKLLFQTRRFTRHRAESLLTDLAGMLTAMGAAPIGSVSSILAQLSEQTRGLAARIASQKISRRIIGASAPTTALEQTIAAIWAKLFQVESVGLDENFFDLGGHSLLLLEAHRRLQAQIKAPLPVVTLFQYPTVRSLSLFLSGETSKRGAQHVFTRATQQREALARMTGRRLGKQ